MKICIVSTSALPAPPSGYGGLEWIAYDSATELAKLGNEVVLITTNESTKIGVSDAIDATTNEVIGKLTVAAAGPTAWNTNGERDMFLNYSEFLRKEFGEGQGVVIDHSWFGYPYFLLTGGEITIDETRSISVKKCPNLKLCHVIHGVTGWVENNQYVPPPGVEYPRIMGVSPHHAAYLSSCFKKPVRYVFNGVKVPDNLQSNSHVEGEKTFSYLLSLNRISEEKGIHNTIDVCLSTNTPLKVVGDDVHVSSQEYVWKIMDICSRSNGLIEYVGLVDNEKKWDYIRHSSGLIACPDASSYVESFYMAAVEGWSAGKPIIAIANGGLADTINDGVNGFKCSNPEEMKQILRNGKEIFIPFGEKEGREVWEKMNIKLEHISHAGITAEAAKYSIENMAKGYLDICKGVMENNPGYQW